MLQLPQSILFIVILSAVVVSAGEKGRPPARDAGNTNVDFGEIVVFQIADAQAKTLAHPKLRNIGDRWFVTGKSAAAHKHEESAGSTVSILWSEVTGFQCYAKRSDWEASHAKVETVVPLEFEMERLRRMMKMVTADTRSALQTMARNEERLKLAKGKLDKMPEGEAKREAEERFNTARTQFTADINARNAHIEMRRRLETKVADLEARLNAVENAKPKFTQIEELIREIEQRLARKEASP